MKSLLQQMPEDCTLEDIQYHLFVMDKVKVGIERAKHEGVVSQDEAEKRMMKWVET